MIYYILSTYHDRYLCIHIEIYMSGYFRIYKYAGNLSHRTGVDILAYMITSWNPFCILNKVVKK